MYLWHLTHWSSIGHPFNVYRSLADSRHPYEPSPVRRPPLLLRVETAGHLTVRVDDLVVGRPFCQRQFDVASGGQKTLVAQAFRLCSGPHTVLYTVLLGLGPCWCSTLQWSDGLTVSGLGAEDVASLGQGALPSSNLDGDAGEGPTS